LSKLLGPSGIGVDQAHKANLWHLCVCAGMTSTQMPYPDDAYLTGIHDIPLFGKARKLHQFTKKWRWCQHLLGKKNRPGFPLQAEWMDFLPMVFLHRTMPR
jgi:hypothetical protein